MPCLALPPISVSMSINVYSLIDAMFVSPSQIPVDFAAKLVFIKQRDANFFFPRYDRDEVIMIGMG